MPDPHFFDSYEPEPRHNIGVFILGLVLGAIAAAFVHYMPL